MDMRFGMKTGVSLRNHVLGGSPVPPGKVQFLRILSLIQADTHLHICKSSNLLQGSAASWCKQRITSHAATRSELVMGQSSKCDAVYTKRLLAANFSRICAHAMRPHVFLTSCYYYVRLFDSGYDNSTGYGRTNDSSTRYSYCTYQCLF